MDINEVVKKYISLRDESTVISERHKEELRPIFESMNVIETWLLQEMEKMGVDSLKTPSGTPYKAVSKSVKMADPESFKAFCFAPVIEAFKNLNIPNMPDILGLLTAGIRWDIIDFRPLKSGVNELINETGNVPPGVSVDQFTKINIRRS